MTLSRDLRALRPAMAEAAQAVLDDWEQDEEGCDPELGEGGVCDRVASAIAGVIDLPGVEITDGGQEGDDHAYLLVYDDTDAFLVDIPASTYETGGGYRWRKRPGVQLDADDVVIERVRRSDIVQENPPWVDATLRGLMPALERSLPSEWLPVPAPYVGRRALYGELGCGSYGCVLPTRDPAMVFKISSDPTEAAFVSAALRIGEFPDGIVRYHGVWLVPETTHRRRPVYALVRESAEAVGHLGRMVASDERSRLEARLSGRLLEFKRWAAEVRKRVFSTRSGGDVRLLLKMAAAMQDWAEDAVDWNSVVARSVESRRRGDHPLPHWLHRLRPRAIAYALRACRIIAAEMVNEDGSYIVGGALDFYMDHGMLLADVHNGNIGKVRRDGYREPIWAITDPGHMVPLEERWLDAEMPTLEA